jgi:hypothetical protein
MDISAKHVLSIFRVEEISSTCYLLHGGFLLGLFFSTEDEDVMFLRNVG